MLRRGIKRVAGRQADIGYRSRSILLIEPGQGIMPVANHVAAPIRCRMARSWGIGSDRSFGCAHCGARYAVRTVASGGNAGESVYCEVCWRQMSRLSSTAQSSYTLIERPGPND